MMLELQHKMFERGHQSSFDKSEVDAIWKRLDADYGDPFKKEFTPEKFDNYIAQKNDELDALEEENDRLEE